MNRRQLSSRAAVWCLLVLLVMIIGCAATKAWKENVDASMANAPSKLDAFPDTSGLLILDVTLAHKGSLSWGAKEKYDITGATIVREGRENHLIHTGATQDIPIFQGLEPGIYRVVSVRGHGGQTSGDFPISSSESFPIEVKAHEPTYFGHLEGMASTKVFQRGAKFSYELKREIESEITAWEKVLKKYPNSAWSPLIVDKISKLQEQKVKGV